ncbi:MAG TPA: hypothetical protein VF116_11990 [Ktedonobacterales bacterium]
MATQLEGVKCPFRAVAEYPPALPYVGQNDCYHRLKDFTQSIVAEEAAHFFAIYGDWAMGKSRLAHELVAQACGKSQGWLLSDGEAAGPLLRPVTDGGGVFPLFVSFANVLSFQGEPGIDTGTAMGKITCAAAAYLADPARARSSHYALLTALRGALGEANPNFDFDRILNLATDSSRSYPERAEAIRAAFSAMTGGRVVRLLVIVDEVESAGEKNPFADEIQREVSERPIPLRAVRDLYESVKEATNTNAYPGLNFLFFNTLVSRRVAHMEALERRMIAADLEKATAADLEQLVRAVRDTGYPLEGMLRDLGQRAFFAADRNLGWFSFIMNKAHAVLVERPDLSIGKVFEGVYQRTGKVFQPHYFTDRDIAPPALKDAMGGLIYNQIPATLSELGIAADLTAPLLDYQDPFQTRFIGEAVVVEVSADQLTTDLLGTNLYASDDRPRLTGEGSVKFDPADVLASLGTFAWEREAAPSEAGAQLWVYTDPADFENQVMFAYHGLGDNLAAGTVRTIHRLLLERHVVRQPEQLFAPTMALLQRFNDLWGKAAANNWLINNKQWEDLITTIESTPGSNNERLLRGIANVLFEAPVEVKPSPYQEVKGQCLTLKLEAYEPLNVTSKNHLVLLKAHETPSAVTDDLRAIRARVPVLVVFSRVRERDAWLQYLRESRNEHLAINVIPHVVEPQTREWEFYIRFALRDQPGGFKTGDVNPVGKDLRGEFKDVLHEAFQSWLKRVEEQGYVLRPFFPAPTANKPAFREFAAGWRKLLAAGVRSALGGESQAVAKALEDYMRERGDDTLLLVEGEGANCRAVVPPIVPRILELLMIKPRKLIELDGEIFYARTTRAVSFPAQGSGVLEQVMTLLQELGVVESDAQSRYLARSAQAISAKFDEAFQRLGAFDGHKSGYARQVSELSAPVQQLAAQLEVNEHNLIVHKTQQLGPRQHELASLPLTELTALPPDTAAFAAVARAIGEITEVLDRVLGKAGQVPEPPDIDPQTLRENINRIAADKTYHEYSIEYRVKFLRGMDEYREQEERAVRGELAAKRERVTQEASGARDGASFPIQPVLALLDQVQSDLDDALPGIVLPQELRRAADDLPLKTLKGANLADALLKLSWYRAQLDETNPAGWWAQYAAARETWQRARAAYDQTRQEWAALDRYFAGTADEHRTKFMGAGLPRDVEELDEVVTGFAATYDTPTMTIAELQQESDAIGDRTVGVRTLIEAAHRGAEEEIEDQLNKTDTEAVRHLAERKHSATPLPDPRRVREARTHEEAHRALRRYIEELGQTGAALCDDANLFKRYLELYRDHQRDVPGDDLVRRYGKDVLEQMQQRQLVTLRTVVDL